MTQQATTRGPSWLGRALGGARKQKSMAKKSHPIWDGRYQPVSFQTYYSEPGKPVWMRREYGKFAEEAYVRNVIAHRCIHQIASNAASVGWRLLGEEGVVSNHPALSLIRRPGPCCAGAEFFESVFATRMISGNAYVLMVTDQTGMPRELHQLRPDRVAVIAGAGGVPAGYEYTLDKQVKRYMADPLTGRSAVLHLKCFHPLDDWYGLSPVEAAAYSIDQHNQAAVWNQALLQNGAKPSGALMVKPSEYNGGMLDDEQFTRLRHQIDEQFSGAANAGRPLLLEGGLEWRDMSHSPREMDFIEAKHSAARDIALAFGVPPQLLGIPGDNTYSNLAEARLAFWEQTILPLLDQVIGAFNAWLLPHYREELRFTYDADRISALAPRRERIWARLKHADFLTDEEKRAMVGLGDAT
ncbi:MAG: phage portal protein [Hyphomicrobiales bacterium]|nr:phage portal protein [Hyphomicrobiales bacterium]